MPDIYTIVRSMISYRLVQLCYMLQSIYCHSSDDLLHGSMGCFLYPHYHLHQVSMILF